LHSCTLGQKLLYIVSFPSFFDPAVANGFHCPWFRVWNLLRRTSMWDE